MVSSGPVGLGVVSWMVGGTPLIWSILFWLGSRGDILPSSGGVHDHSSPVGRIGLKGD